MDITDNITPLQIYQLQAKLFKDSFDRFLIRGFYELNPGLDYRDNWHIKLIAKYLSAVESGRIKRLIINMPPRHLKSITINVLWSAWLLAQNPKHRIISASYSAKLSEKHGNDARQIIKSPWYQFLFPDTKIMPGQDTKAKFATTKNGFRLATSVGGTLTGEGADTIIIDDPHTPQQALSQKHRNRVLDWFDNTLISRLNQPKSGKIVLVMQRLHEQDLAGYLLNKSEDWTLLNIPLVAKSTQKVSFDKFEYTRKEGATIDLDIIDSPQSQKIKQDIGSAAFAAQYQQSPLPSGGKFIKLNWLQQFDSKKFATNNCDVYQSWDSAFKTGSNNDYSVCVTAAIHKGQVYILDIYRVKLEFTDLKKAVLCQYNKFKPKAILIEDKASGQILIQDIMRENVMPIIKVRPKLDKIARFMQAVHLFEAENIFIDKNMLGYADLIAELMAFPDVAHDDQVDALVQLLNWQQNRYSSGPRIRRL